MKSRPTVPETTALLKESRNRLARARRCFEEVYQSQPEFSLSGERVRELLIETQAWLDDYCEEVRQGGEYPVVQSENDRPAEVGTGEVAQESPDDGAGQSETASPGRS
jgi:hypothetical protein